ncbi:MAG: TrkH family potassium uptake protein [Ruminococcaceae bacterium]|nr:TrkH family potassium uptake protein [Oscillospiraceae bacterium]
MNYKMVGYIIGRIMVIMAILMCLPFIVALLHREDTIFGFALAILCQLIIGFAFSVKKPKNTELYAKEGLVIVALVWILTSLFGALPFYLSREIPSYLDALFETISGFTTTGATILSDIEALSDSALFWRSFTHWIGGMGVLVFVLAVLPKTHVTQSIHLMRAEVPGPQVGKLVSRMRSTARILYGIYIILTLLEVLCLRLAGMPWFDSLLNSFATAGTGGFCLKNASIAAYNSAAIDAIITFFMIVFGINFTLFYLLLTGHVLQVLKSEELRWFLGIIALATLCITLDVSHLYESFTEAFRYSVFQVSSIITTTGFITADYSQWPMFSQTILVLLMFVGAMAGSTGGGIKVSRVMILLKTVLRELRHQLRPRSVSALKLEGKLVEEKTFLGVMSYMSIYVLFFVVSMVLVSLNNLSFASSFSAVTTCLNNVGPGLEAVGPVNNFGSLNALSKLTLSIDMLAGRLELLPILTLFTPSAWRRR